MIASGHLVAENDIPVTMISDIIHISGTASDNAVYQQNDVAFFIFLLATSKHILWVTTKGESHYL